MADHIKGRHSMPSCAGTQIWMGTFSFSADELDSVGESIRLAGVPYRFRLASIRSVANVPVDTGNAFVYDIVMTDGTSSRKILAGNINGQLGVGNPASGASTQDELQWVNRRIEDQRWSLDLEVVTPPAGVDPAGEITVIVEYLVE